MEEEDFTFGSVSRELYFAGSLIDEIVVVSGRGVRRLLRVHGARADVVVPERGVSALHVLAGLGAEDFAAAVTLRVLQREGVDLNVRSEEGLTPAHVAAIYGRCRVLEVLLTNGADPTLLDYRLQLDTEGHAYRERQWQALAMLSTYGAILKHEQFFSKYQDPQEDILSDHKQNIVDRDYSRRSSTEPDANASSSTISPNLDTKPSSPRKSKLKRTIEPIKNTHNSKLEECEMHYYGYSKSSLKLTNPHRRGNVDSSDYQESHVDRSRGLNNTMLCKMSRIFLFVLKKRRTIYRQMQEA